MFNGFEVEDFKAFETPLFAERMAAIKSRVRPKLQQLGEALTPQLIQRFHTEFFPHVAAHMRRRVNPPPETWVAFGPNKRGYKGCHHFAVVIDREGVYTRFVLKSEASDKKTLSKNLKKEQKGIQSFLKRQPLYWFGKAGATTPVRIQEGDRDFWTKVAKDLVEKKEFNFDIGFGLDKNDRRIKSKDYIELAFHSFTKLHLFYRLAS